MKKVLLSLLIVGYGFCANENSSFSPTVCKLSGVGGMSKESLDKKTKKASNIEIDDSERFYHENFSFIANRLIQSPKIQTLTFTRRKSIRKVCLEPIVDAVCSRESGVSYLGLRYTQIDNEDMALIAPYLGRCKNPYLVVDLRGTNITNQGLQHLCEALAKGEGRPKDILFNEDFNVIVDLGRFLERNNAKTIDDTPLAEEAVVTEEIVVEEEKTE